VPGPPTGKEVIGLRIVSDPLGWKKELPVIPRLRNVFKLNQIVKRA